jgi:spore coat polysaccharide biosynthesis protein SpsF
MEIDDVVVATSKRKADDIVERYENRAGASVFRGSESDGLGRIHNAARDARADVIMRITADCPLISLPAIDEVVRKLVETGVDYSANTQIRTLPRGLDAEAFTSDSFDIISKEGTEPHYKEHVTYFCTENPSRFECVSVNSRDIFEEEWTHDRSDLWLTLDDVDDYELLREVNDKVTYEDILDIKSQSNALTTTSYSK